RSSMRTIITALTLAGALIAGLAHAAPQWREGRDYRAGEIVEYRGQQWRAVQSHTAWRGAGWTPGAAHSLWKPVHQRDNRYHDKHGHDTGQWRGPSGYPGDPGHRGDEPWRRDPHWRPAAWHHDRAYRQGEWVW